ncbi:TPA: phage tail protein, partial [Acinetobacter baumannii]|nr:phage tail protein [Acinetobacter baumannii]
MAALYHSLFTELGLELLRESIQNGTKLGITHMSFGDGGGNLPIPDATYTQLINEVYRVQLNRLAPSKENPNWLEADGVIPSAVGGFNIREVGLWAGDVMVAYANYPPTYKPSGDQGTAQIKTIRIVLQIDNTANFELKIDASVVMATIQSVEEAKLEAINHANDLAKIQLENVETINDLANIEKVNGKSVFVKGFEIGSSVGNGIFTYYEDQKNINDGGVI